MGIATDRILDFLTKWETRQLRGYIPCKPGNYRGGPKEGYTAIGASGVTIATGLDLGQQALADLKRFGIAGDLQNKLIPYLGKQKQKAIDALQGHPLTISDEECDRINQGVHADYIRRAASLYDKSSPLRFENIPAEAQTVIVSLFYHLGAPSQYPDGVWEALKNGNWPSAATFLKKDTSIYKFRRRDEGSLLEGIYAR